MIIIILMGIYFIQILQYKQIQHPIMSDINSSLIGFLKKKSLFSNSPDRNMRRRQKSRQKIMVNTTSFTPRNQPQNVERSLREQNTKSTKNLHKERSSKNLQQYETQSDIGVGSMEIDSPIRYFNTQKNAMNKPIRRNFNFKNPEQTKQKEANNYHQLNMQEKSMNQNRNNSNNNIWAGLVSSATTFQSARLESKQCLQNLSTKLQTQISNINYKLDVFQTKMTKILNNEFNSLHEHIIQIVNNVFSESEANIRAYIRQQEQELAGQLLVMREKLKKQQERVQVMREDINKPNWRKVAGELLSTQLEQKVEQMVRESKMIDIGHWQIGDLGANQINALQLQLKEMVKLTGQVR